MKIPEPDEWRQQASIFLWADSMLYQYPELWLLNGSLNGVRLSMGQAKKAKRCGMKAGYPDIFLPVARKGFYGLYIELKKEKGGVVSKEQRDWLDRLSTQNYFAVVCRGENRAIKVIEDYLKK
jgi:hypothetical protein